MAAACCSSKKPMWVGWVEDTDKSSSPASDSAAGCKGSNKTAWWIEPRVPRQLGRRQAPDAFPAAPKILVGAVHVHTNAGRRRPFRTAARGCMDGEPPSLLQKSAARGPAPSESACMQCKTQPLHGCTLRCGPRRTGESILQQLCEHGGTHACAARTRACRCATVGGGRDDGQTAVARAQRRPHMGAQPTRVQG